MNIGQLKPVIEALYNAGRTGMIWGPPGIGKSSVFRAAAESMRKRLGLTGPVLERHEVYPYIQAGGDINQAFGMFDLRLSQSDPVDIGGLPRENKLNGTMERLVPDWFPSTRRTDLPKFGILLLDELPSAPPSVQNAAYQITLDGVIGDQKMKEGWGCFGAGNRLTDGGQFFKMANALANRMVHLDVESSLDSWLDWAINAGMEHSLVAFMQFKPDLLNTYEAHVKAKGKGLAFATERAWEAVNDSIVNNPGLDDVSLQAILTGTVGEGNAAEYLAFRQTWTRMPSVQQIFIDPMSAALPEDAATQYAVCTALSAQTDYNNLPMALDYVSRFQAQGRAELAVLYLKDMQRRAGINQERARETGQPYQNPVSNPAYSVWGAKNRDLFGQ
jgi:hypothetical protein